MAFDPTPWMIAGGARHSADLGRVLAWAATNGEEGVIHPSGWRVWAFGTPTSQVNVGGGAGLIVNPTDGYRDQSYVARSGNDTYLDVPPTGAGGRSDLVIVRIEDPQFPPWQAPADPATAIYARPFLVQNVAPGTTSAASLNLGYPALALARIDQPANNSAVTQAMIADVRRIANPRSRRTMFTNYPAVKEAIAAGATPGTLWPTVPFSLYVPPWATRAVVHGLIAGAKVGHPDPAVNGDVDTQLRVQMGNAQASQYTEFSQQEWLTVQSAVTGVRGYMRADMSAGGTLDITQFAGTQMDIRFSAAITAGQGELYVDRYSTIFCDIELQETPV